MFVTHGVIVPSCLIGCKCLLFGQCLNADLIHVQEWQHAYGRQLAQDRILHRGMLTSVFSSFLLRSLWYWG
jgi:hypothetical protein